MGGAKGGRREARRPGSAIPARAPASASAAATPIAHAHGLLVLTLSGDRISALTRFIDNALLPPFGLPRTLRGWPARG